MILADLEGLVPDDEDDALRVEQALEKLHQPAVHAVHLTALVLAVYLLLVYVPEQLSVIRVSGVKHDHVVVRAALVGPVKPAMAGGNTKGHATDGHHGLCVYVSP